MSFFSRLFAKLFGKKRVQEPERVPYTPTVERPPYATTGKFQSPEVTWTEPMRVRAITEPIREEVDGPPPSAKFDAWPKDTYEFKPGVFYVPYKGSQGGPFTTPAEAEDWMRRVDRRDASSVENDKATAAIVYSGPFAAKNLILGPKEGREAAFVYAADQIAFQQGKGTELITRRAGLFSGTYAEISMLINYGEQEQIFEHKSYGQTVHDFPDTPLKQAVMKFL